MTRRGVLRRGAFAAGAVTVGVAGFSGTAVASFCPRTPGYWANHDWCEVTMGSEYSVGECVFGSELDPTAPCEAGAAVDDICESGTKTFVGLEKTMREWQAFLTGRTRGDKAYIMAKHVVATRLNFWRRPGGERDTSCIDQDLDLSAYGLGTMSLNEVQRRASQWLAASDWPDPVRSWWVDVDGTATDGEPLKNVLDDFNNGRLDLDDCNCPSAE